MANGNTAWAYLDGIAASHPGVEELPALEVVGGFDADAIGDPFLTPWKRGHRAALRAACGY